MGHRTLALRSLPSWGVVTVLVAAFSCSQPPADSRMSRLDLAPDLGEDSLAKLVDSVALERTECLGTCPAYRLVIFPTEDVRFESRNRGDSGRTASGTMAPGTFRDIVWAIDVLSLLALPDEIQGSDMCGPVHTDASTATLHLYLKDHTKVIEDYQGCTWAPSGLRNFEDQLDRAAGTNVWVRPNEF